VLTANVSTSKRYYRQTGRREKASKEFMLAGKRCSPALIIVFIAIIVGALTFAALHHGPEQQPGNAPIHDQQ
jgi:hypothetical protein